MSFAPLSLKFIAVWSRLENHILLSFADTIHFCDE